MFESSYFIRIVILNYNESIYTIDLINQLKNQTYKYFEIVVVDNASREEELNKLKDSLPEYVKIIYSSKNLGYAGGNNLGLRLVEENEIDYFLVLNNDLIIKDPNFIYKMLNGIIDNKKNNVVASSPLVDTISLNRGIENQIQVRRVLNKWNMYFLNIPIFKIFIKKTENYFLYRKEMPYLEKYTICDSINGAAFMIEKHFLKSIDFLDDKTFLYYEEIILGRQIKDSGKTCVLNGFASLQHLQGVSTKSDIRKVNVRMERYKYESSLYYLKKYEDLDFFSSYIYILMQEITIRLKQLLFFIRGK